MTLYPIRNECITRYSLKQNAQDRKRHLKFIIIIFSYGSLFILGSVLFAFLKANI